jgi:hypothetical protein
VRNNLPCCLGNFFSDYSRLDNLPGLMFVLDFSPDITEDDNQGWVAEMEGVESKRVQPFAKEVALSEAGKNCRVGDALGGIATFI